MALALIGLHVLMATAFMDLKFIQGDLAPTVRADTQGGIVTLELIGLWASLGGAGLIGLSALLYMTAAAISAVRGGLRRTPQVAQAPQS
jgi:hypothetical protein